MFRQRQKQSHERRQSQPSTPSSCDPVDIFREACQHFQSSLSEKQREILTEHSDAESLVKDLQNRVRNHPIQTSSLTRCCHQIARLSDRMSPFFKVLDLLVSSHPEFAAIAWGSIRLVFVLGTEHVAFLARVSELFETMSRHVPSYEFFLCTLRELDARAKVKETQLNRILTTMACIYADLLQFSYEVCQLFSRKPSGRLSLRGSFRICLSPLLPNPFNVRIDTLLKRWATNKEIFEFEMEVLSSGYQMKTLGEIEDMMSRLTKKGGFEASNAKGSSGNQERQPNVLRDSDQITFSLRQWINPPPWLALYEKAQNRRLMNSTKWLLVHPAVNRWLNPEISAHDRPFLHAISIQGKPGYGKTTLCTTLVEHLQTSTRSDTHQNVATAFFYFDKQRPQSSSSSAAWRAVLVQLLHIMSVADEQVLDMFLLLRDEERSNRSGQLFASDNEVLSYLMLIIQRLDRFYLVIDGLDECDDAAGFLSRLEVLGNSATITSVALFGRPTVAFPPILRASTHILPLDVSLNQNDIMAYVHNRVTALQENGLLTMGYDIKELVEMISKRADGMFLWCVLLMEYLHSPYLSPLQRHDSIRNLNRLTGLDLLYGAIFKSLGQGNHNTRETAVRLFEIVAYARRPLHITELQYAIATPLTKRLDRDDVICDMGPNLGLLSGALMEMDAAECVRFVHLSVLEYLTGTGTQGTNESLLDQHSSRRTLAGRCVSYLFLTVEAGPLAGSPHVVPDAASQIRRYPFLNYAVEFWASHLLECLEDTSTSVLTEDDQIVVQLVSDFVSSKPSITTWIEASWMFKRPPQVRNGPTDSFFNLDSCPPRNLDHKYRTSWELARETLLQLAGDLTSLNKSWEHVLSNEPNEIWQPSTSTFSQSSFWKRVSGTDIAAFEAQSFYGWESLCLKTKVSSDGSRLGIVRLYIPSSGLTEISTDFPVTFELWSVDPKGKLQESSINIPPSCLKPFIRETSTHFRFPVAISADLRRVAVPGCVVNVAELGSEVDMEQDAFAGYSQLLDFTANCYQYGAFPFRIEDFELQYDLQISGSGEFLTTVHKSCGLVSINHEHSTTLRFITIYRDIMHQSPGKPCYRHLASIALKPTYNVREDEDGEACALLHPEHPVLAVRFDGLLIIRSQKGEAQMLGPPHTGKVGLWTFTKAGATALRFINKDTDKLHFDHDGEYFCGIKVNQAGPSNSEYFVMNDESYSSTRSQSSHLIHANRTTEIFLSQMHQPAVQSMGEIASYVDENGTRFASQLHNSGNSGVILSTLREDGLMEAEELTRLPFEISRDFEATLLSAPSYINSEAHKIFIAPENRPFKKYRIDKPNATPFTLNRSRKTINTLSAWRTHTLDHRPTFHAARAKRVEQIGHPSRRMNVEIREID